MADTLHIKLVTPTRKIYEADADSIVAPGVEGEFTLLPGHDPWMVALGMGEMVIASVGTEDKFFFTSGGFCQIDEDNVVVLAEVCEPSLEIDTERAEAAKKRAEERIQKSTSDETIDILRAEIALKRALFRLDIAGR